MTPCDLEKRVDGYYCRRCGLRRFTLDAECDTRRCTAQCRTPPPPGLGDHTERLLKSLGVTPDRYRAAKELFGLAPTCGCEERKAWLNRVGQWFGL